jgi:hypothetical protein
VVLVLFFFFIVSLLVVGGVLGIVLSIVIVVNVGSCVVVRTMLSRDKMKAFANGDCESCVMQDLCPAPHLNGYCPEVFPILNGLFDNGIEIN